MCIFVLLDLIAKKDHSKNIYITRYILMAVSSFLFIKKKNIYTISTLPKSLKMIPHHTVSSDG